MDGLAVPVPPSVRVCNALVGGRGTGAVAVVGEGKLAWVVQGGEAPQTGSVVVDEALCDKHVVVAAVAGLAPDHGGPFLAAGAVVPGAAPRLVYSFLGEGRLIELELHMVPVALAAIHLPDGSGKVMVAVAGACGLLLHLLEADGEVTAVLVVDDLYSMVAVGFSPDASCLVSVSMGGNVAAFDRATSVDMAAAPGGPLSLVIGLWDGAVVCYELAPDGEWVFVCMPTPERRPSLPSRSMHLPAVVARFISGGCRGLHVVYTQHSTSGWSDVSVACMQSGGMRHVWRGEGVLAKGLAVTQADTLLLAITALDAKRASSVVCLDTPSLMRRVIGPTTMCALQPMPPEWALEARGRRLVLPRAHFLAAPDLSSVLGDPREWRWVVDGDSLTTATKLWLGLGRVLYLLDVECATWCWWIVGSSDAPPLARLQLAGSHLWLADHSADLCTSASPAPPCPS
ncbi:uncharacterized protein AMSG_08547 [Thecamonas trahens ATCC 50062]|uniref:Uncharacterized protein n=1 Tax=Thecamonas trahens ATCC 50062 TaxID=461836 RepID=A0A0L0DJU1_THETB|nr:hypothetical protein AMSG_08547 [Thecamonas trahens ATCC 50062]KNC52674.1 hypothetical protein AMSG_08547 [Thecamonas trahens ATCC 50062]|eukprot:XP_013755223.1 hypothetical protein AMSG_08547 [Thecamonas trahens ATCC 50062]